jgi:hypothetical protein
MGADNEPLRDDDISTSQGGSTSPRGGDGVDTTDSAGRDADGTDREEGTGTSEPGAGHDADGTDTESGGGGSDDSDSRDSDDSDSDDSDSGGRQAYGDADGTDR